MSTHSDCGADITWLRRDDNPEKYLPPMEYAGEVYIQDDNGAAKRVHAYRMHLCDPEAIVAWQDYKQRLAEAKGEEFTDYAAARERDREEIWEIALGVACRVCHMLPGERCVSQATRLKKTGKIIETKNPHPARIEDAYSQRGLS